MGTNFVAITELLLEVGKERHPSRRPVELNYSSSTRLTL
jgi:hypothetical protein